MRVDPAPLTAPDVDLERDLAVLEERLSSIVNTFARYHPGFELTSLTADYFVRHNGAEREYLVELSLRL